MHHYHWVFLISFLCTLAHVECATLDFIPDSEPPIQITLVSPGGIKFQMTGDVGHVGYFHVHFNVNKPLHGVASGDFNSPNINAAAQWTFEVTDANVKPGDTIYYWILVHYQNKPTPTQQWTGQQWVATSSETTTTSTTKDTTTAVTTPEKSSTETSPATTSKSNTTHPVPPQPTPKPEECTSYPCLIFEDNFDTLNFSTWEHEITASGGGNWEFEYYVNNRSNSYARNGNLHIKPIIDSSVTGTRDVWDMRFVVHHSADLSVGWKYGSFVTFIVGEFEELKVNEKTAAQEFMKLIKPSERDMTIFAPEKRYFTLTSDRYGETFLSSGTLDLWGGQPADQCTSEAFYGCFRQGTGATFINPIQSARLRCVRSFNFKYGKIEARAKMPIGDWIWPAIWMLPTRQEYGLWPASGEIDLVETRGNRDLKDNKGNQIGVKNAGQTLHWGPFWPANFFEKTHVAKDATSGTFASDFHTFGAEWDEDHLSFFIDGQETLKVDPGKNGFWDFGKIHDFCPKCDNPWNQTNSNKMAPFDREFYIILNVAVGGTNGFFPDDAVNAGSPKPWTNKEQNAFRDFWNGRGQWYPTWNPTKNNGEDAAMKVDYIRVWKLKP